MTYACGYCGSGLEVEGEIFHEPDCSAPGLTPSVRIDDRGDAVCQHGTAMDVHCCNCHNGFIFDMDHECPEAK